MSDGREITIRGILGALGIAIDAEELDGRWGVAAHRFVPIEGVYHDALEVESQIQAEELQRYERGY